MKIGKVIFVVFAVLVITASAASGLVLSPGNANVDAGINSGEIVPTGDGQPPPTPFLILGYINDSIGEPVINPNVTITNLNTTEVFIVKTNVSSNYYQVVTSSWDVSADNTLMMNVTDGTSYNGTEHMVTENETNITGGFTQNITLMRGATYGDVVINEIMYDPTGYDNLYEWIELYNNDSEEIDVSGWVLNGTIGGSDTILSGTMVAGTYLLIAKNVTAFEERYNVSCPKITGNWSALANNGDWVNLSNATGSNIDSVYYPGSFTANYSAERNATGSWEKSLIDGGTPCEENSVTQAGVALPCTCGDICVNTTGWWHAGAAFNASNTPIQHATNNVTAGETICVKNGNYNENVDVGKRLTIRSENGSADCIVNAPDLSDHVFNVTADYVNISGFTVQNTTGGGVAGIYLSNANHCNIAENNASNNRYGIYLYDSCNNNLTNNNANNNTGLQDSKGIVLEESANNNLTRNVANNNSEIGFWLYSDSHHNNLTNNNATLNEVGFWLEANSHNNTLANNTANENKEGGIQLDDSNDNTLTNNTCNGNGGEESGIHLAFSHRNTLTDNNCSWNDGDGISLDFCNYNELAGNTAYYNGYDGFWLNDSHNNELAGNSANNNGESGIHLNFSNVNIITSNEVFDNWGWESEGIYLVSSNNNVLTGNNVAGNSAGIHLDPSSHNTIADNDVNDNWWHGIWLRDFSDHNEVTGNTVLRNGGECGHGIYVQFSSYNDIVGNNASETWWESGICVEGWLPVSYNNVTDNVATNNGGDGIALMGEDNCTIVNNTASDNGGNGIKLEFSFDNNVTDNICNDNGGGVLASGGFMPAPIPPQGHGITLSNSNNNIVSRNEANGNSGTGINQEFSSYNDITDNTASENGADGISVSAEGPLFSYSNITNNTATNNGGAGIALMGEDNCTIVNNTASDNDGNGIHLWESTDNEISNNIANNNSECGIRLEDSSYNNVTGNNASWNGFDGINVIGPPESYNNITDNIANHNSDAGILLEGVDNCIVANNTASYNDWNGIRLESSNNNTLMNNTANENDWDGISLGEFSNDNTLSNNSVSDNEYGIWIEDSAHNTIDNNNVRHNLGGASGIHLENASYTTIAGNNVTDNDDGIYLNSSFYNNLTNNNVSNNDYGVVLSLSSNNTLTNSTASNSTAYGFWSDEGSHNNTVKNLTISSYPTTISFTYENGVGLKGVDTAPANPAEKTNISKFVNATNVTADSWIFLNVSYEGGDLGNVDEDSLRMWKYNGTWAEVSEPNGVNTVENYVYANITEFSIFAPLGNVIPINITITSPENTTYASTCVRLNFTVKPEGTALAWIGYSLDGGPNVTIAGNTTVFDALGVTPPCDHNIVVYASDTHGNMAASNMVYFTMHPGDIKDDGKVDGFDLQRLAWAFLSEPGDPNWNERADLKCDNKIDGFDLQRLAWNFLNDYTIIC
ncbi:MAG: Right handed beta helix region [Candidatus Argoarchaeum ethanivorans]|uniref:Right handed beta helix region n=1 Tax=Candidatus Argoarchaeum ethanivorans TaxID=2608793 RepID=A0A811T590_9EURY|nr:MAG: Right handed beta helix region [Candidatus Argoarchaeum ethanivorans]